MPPKNSRKRKVTSPIIAERPTKRVSRAEVASASRAVDEDKSNIRPIRKTAKELRDIVSVINEKADDSSAASSSDESFEEVAIHGRPSEEDEEEMEWEDALVSDKITTSSAIDQPEHVITDLNIKLAHPNVAPDYSRMQNDKKGPSKIERAIRVDTHGMHVLSLMWHNTIRNSWCNDHVVHETLLNGLSEGLKAEIETWRIASGLKSSVDRISASKDKKKSKVKQEKKSRDWSSEADRQELGRPDLSRGDPTIQLLRQFSAYWKKRFEITAPGIRKRGYKAAVDLEQDLKAFAENPGHASRFGERVTSLAEFRTAAKKLAGSRDVSAQLFSALLRAIGIESRLIASLQPAGFGWSKLEDAKMRKQGTESGVQSATESAQSIQLSDKTKTRRRPKITSQEQSTDSELSEPGSDISDSDLDIPSVITNRKQSKKQFDKDLLFPVYWTEVLSPVTSTYYAVSTQLTPHVATNAEGFEKFEPRGAATERAKQVICYVVAYSKDGSAKDVTVRYLKRRQLPGKTKGFRLPPEKIPVYNRRGTKVVKHVESDWFKRVMRFYARPGPKRTQADEIEDEGDLVPFKPEKTVNDLASSPETLQAYKASKEFVLERHLRREEAIRPTAKVVRQFTFGKGEKEVTEPVFLRKDVVTCRTVESWHKEGREVKMGSQPLKMVPTRAVTLIRKQEVEHAIRQTGEKPKQGLYSRDQTKWIIPPPIENGQIPKNAYGNIDVYVPSMVPKGAVHIPYSGTKKVCNKLGIDFAEACTGFEFGRQMAVPVITGVVVAEEHEAAVVELWKEEEEKKQRREDEKREKKILGLWRKFAMGLKIMDRVQEEYGIDALPDGANPFIKQAKREHGQTNGHTESKHPESKHQKRQEEEEKHDMEGHANDYGGGFLREGMDVLEPEISHLEIQMGSQPEKRNNKRNDKNAGNGPMSLRMAHRTTKQEDPHDLTERAAMDEALDELDEDLPVGVNGAESDQNEEDADDISDDDDDQGTEDNSDLSDEEYEGFIQAKSPMEQAEPRGGKTRAARMAATSSPYFNKKKR